MSDPNTAMPAVRLTVASIEGNVGEYLSHEFLRTVNGVFDEMLSRLYYGAEKRKGWAAKEPWQELTEAECRSCVRNALVKGNLIDAMNYIMFAHLNEFKHTASRQPTVDEPVSVDSQMRDQLAMALGIAGRTWDEMLEIISLHKKHQGIQIEIINEIRQALGLSHKSDPQEIKDAIRELTELRKKAVLGIAEPYTKAAKAYRGVAYEKFAPELRPSAPSSNTDLDLTMVADESGIPSVLFRFKNEKDRDDYLPLLRTFLGALEQAAYGKGRVRHANDLPFIEQPILTMAHMLNSDAGLAQQVIKKTIEARTLPTKDARISELRGTLVYAAAMILFEEMHGKQDDPDELDGDF